MNPLTIKDLPVNEKHVVMRVDFNVPLKEDLSISDDTRIIYTHLSQLIKQ